jgi:hypothetical protein
MERTMWDKRGMYTWLVVAALLGSGLTGCFDHDGADTDADAGLDEVQGSAEALIRGRVTDVSGKPLAGVEVGAEGKRTHTDEQGRFELKVASEGEVRVSVESDKFSGAELPVSAKKSAVANLEVAVKERSSLKLPDAEKGGRVEAADGFALSLPSDALLDADNKRVQGDVEVRYALIKTPDEITAAPGRMQSDDNEGLDGFGMAEVRFYKNGKRLQLAKEMQVEVPLHKEHKLPSGQEVDLYELGKKDLRWKQAARGKVEGDKVIVRTQRDEWLGAADKLPVDSCVKGRLGLDSTTKRAVANTTLRAARGRGLSLVQAETGEDGSFCLPVTPDDDWRVSTFYEADGEAFGIEVEVKSSDATGMCGGDGCKDVGDVALPAL